MLEGPLVFVDIDTQRDFLEESGTLFVRGSQSIIPNLDRLSRPPTAAGSRLATACCHVPEDPELQQFPPHCMAGTDGQRRIPATDRPDSVVLGVGDRFEGGIRPHLTLEKSTFDVFSRPDAEPDRMLQRGEARFRRLWGGHRLLRPLRGERTPRPRLPRGGRRRRGPSDRCGREAALFTDWARQGASWS